MIRSYIPRAQGQVDIVPIFNTVAQLHRHPPELVAAWHWYPPWSSSSTWYAWTTLFFASGKVCIKQQALTTVFCQVIRVYKSFPPSLELYPPCVFARSTLSSLESGPCQSAEKRIKWVKSYNYLNLPPCQWWRWWVRWWGFYSRTTGSRTPPRFPHCSPSKWQPMQISLILG